jgi:hypothetical protein
LAVNQNQLAATKTINATTPNIPAAASLVFASLTLSFETLLQFITSPVQAIPTPKSVIFFKILTGSTKNVRFPVTIMSKILF